MPLAYGLAAMILSTAVVAGQTGESLYLGQCAVCHGAKGEGGRGAVLTRTPLRHAATDDALFRVIRRGIPDSGMPGTALSEREIRLLMDHVRTLARNVSSVVKGSPAEGAKLYHGKGACARCHTWNGSGAVTGPDLSEIGARRSQEHLRQSLVDPAAHVPDGFLLLQITDNRGKAITGTRVNEDTFSIQLREAGGRLVSYWKTELQLIKPLRGQSPMPSYRSLLSERELDDLTAFLMQAEVAQ